jgi:hypothetical protein
MKRITILLLSLFVVASCHSQLIKRIGQRAKENAEWKLQQKVNQKVDQGFDSLTAPKKKKGAKESTPDQPKENTTTDPKNNNSAKPPAMSGKAAPAEEEEMGTKEGYVTLKLSADNIFTGGSVLISGESILYKNFKQVEIKVSGPSPTDTRNISLTSSGKFNAEWVASEKTGDYTVTVTSSDKKATASATFSVAEIDIIFADDWPEENTKATKAAYDKLDEAVDQVETEIGSKDKAELDKKMAEVKEKVDEVLKLFKSLNTAGKEISKLARSGKRMSPNLAGNLSALNDNLTEHARQMKTFERVTDHKPQDNTVCEHLVMVSEACAAFSTFTNLWATSVKGIIKNIVLDKGVPKVVEVINKGRAPSAAEFGAKETSKIFATALGDAESLTTKLGTAGFTGDIVQFASDVLLKRYCGVYKGELKHDYTVIFRNGNGETWWKYGVEVQATFTLRYPKDKNTGKVIKMKGNIEGNGTKFTFFQNVQVEDEFKKGTKEQIEVVPLKTITPIAVPVATSQNDALGFGAVARGAFTPAYFNLPVDAEYNTDDDKIKLFLNIPIIDFSPAVTNQFIFLLVGGDLLPYFKRMNFPIHKIFRTLGSVMAKQNEFAVDKDSKGNPSFIGKVNKHLGGKADKMEHDLNYTVTAKKE